MYIRFSNLCGALRMHIGYGKKQCTDLRLMALSNCQGMLVAPKTRTPVSSWPTPFICTRNSVLIRREASDSPSPLDPHKESTSSMKIIAGLFSRAIWNSCFTNLTIAVSKAFDNQMKNSKLYLSDSPIHLLTRSEELTLKNVLLASVATALAKYDFPVPGGPYSSIPFQGVRFPVKR